MTKKTAKAPKIRSEVAAAIRDAQANHSRWLHLNNRQLTEIPDEILELHELEFLDLSENKLSSIPERLWSLPKLKTVVLLENPVETLPNRSSITIDISIYRRCRNQLNHQNVNLVIDRNVSDDDVAFWLAELRASNCPREVLIGDWNLFLNTTHEKPSPQMRKILRGLSRLKSTESLSLRGLQLDGVPLGIRQLSDLKHLYLNALGLTKIPHWIGELNLESFSLMENKFTSLPDSLRNLTKLKYLDLSWNSQITKLPQFLFDLISLEELRMSHISEIPAEVLRLSHLRSLATDYGAVKSPPPEVAKEGLDAIRNYWRQRADEGVDYLSEAKLIILGEAGAGKTSLAKKIENPNYKLRTREKSTEGIDVIRYRFPTVIRTHENGEEKALEREFQVNIWDFGGQEIYHATHQFFLTKRSVYVLVCDDRKEDTDFSYWLQVVEMLSDASPLLIVQNEKQDRTRDINLSSLRAQFGNLRGALATNLDTNRDLDKVIKAIQKELESLPHVGIGLPATWKRVREVLEGDPHDFITLEEYLKICEKHGFKRREDKLQLSGYLHDLGICLHFQEDPLLNKTVILKPSWGTDAVYRVLDDSEVIAARGLFTRTELERIWSEEKYAGMQDELLRLMMKFQLCYALEADRAFIAPQLLSSEQPSYPWEPSGSVVVRYEYGFLPKGIITRFIVAMHRLIAGERLVWKTGVVLERDGTRAEIIEEYSQRRIRVRVLGPDTLGLLAIVDDQLERLHASFPRLQYERFLPCSCVECQARAEPYGFALERLINMALKQQNIQCHISGEMVDAGQLVREILPGALRRNNRGIESSISETGSEASPPSPEVFISYGWTTESKKIVEILQAALEDHGIRLLRDREEVRYKDSIRDFMRRIGQGKCVVVVISDKYLKSENCMFEMVEIAKTPGLRERIFPIVLSDANIYKATGRVKYVRYWEDEIQELDEALKTVRGDNLTKLQEDLNLYAEIRRVFDGITDTLRDMNALTPDQHEGSGFEELIRRIRAQLAV